MSTPSEKIRTQAQGIKPGSPSEAGPCCGDPLNNSILSPDEIRSQVQDFYAERARRTSSCCGDMAGSTLYQADQLTEFPDEVSNFTLGCGDPITLAELKPGETVLDLGSGGGLDCFLAAKQVGESGHIIGLDMTPEMLERARSAAKRLGFQNIEFRKGYLEDMPVEDASVDVIISNCVINLSPNKPQVFAEMFRALKPGGRVSVSDIVTNGELPESVKRSMHAWGACIAGALEAGEYTDSLRTAGFVDVKVTAKSDEGILLEDIPANTLFSAAITARRPQSR